MTMTAKQLLFLLGILIVPPTIAVTRSRRRKNSHPDQRDIKIINESKVRIDVKWINPNTRQPADSTIGPDGLIYGGETGLNSFAGHSFVVEELANAKTKKCLHKLCRKAYFTVSKHEDQVYIVNDRFLVDAQDSHTKATQQAKEALQKCQLQTNRKSLVTASQDETLNPLDLDQMYACLEASINETLTETQNDIDFQRSVRKDMARRLVPYTCGSGLPGTREQIISTTRALVNTTFQFYDQEATPPYRVSSNVQVLFETPNSAILLVQDFWTAQECRELIHESQPAVHSSNVPLAAKRTNPVVKRAVRKLQEFAKMFLKGSVFTYEHDPVVRLYTSWPLDKDDDECDMTNDGTCFDKDVPQQNQVIVKTPYNLPSDAATMRIFCEVPKQGGAIHFPQAGVHVHLPELKEGSALFTMYADPQTGQQDEELFLNEMIECPVVEGTLVQVVDHYHIGWSR
ncbi:hypothetical protein MPSEU_000320700 [Mayamaea pseudoterrestris]|nr:hypothetical protein MPSEU_000320700 [Mayamaea pseudoterrestris]